MLLNLEFTVDIVPGKNQSLLMFLPLRDHSSTIQTLLEKVPNKMLGNNGRECVIPLSTKTAKIKK